MIVLVLCLVQRVLGDPQLTNSYLPFRDLDPTGMPCEINSSTMDHDEDPLAVAMMIIGGRTNSAKWVVGDTVEGSPRTCLSEFVPFIFVTKVLAAGSD